MKSLCGHGLLTLGLGAAALFGTPGWAQSPPAAVSLIDPQAHQILDRVIQALGGQTFLNAKSLTTRGRVFFFQDGATAGLEPYQIWFEYPDKRRFAIAKNKKSISMDTGNVTYEGESKQIILINNGDKGWELDQYGLILQPDQQIQNWILANRYSLENLLRLRINEPRVLIQVGKVDFVDNIPTQGLEITASGGISVRLDLNRQTLLPCRISYRVRNVKDNAWDDYADAYADYKPIDGIQTPMHITRYLNDERIGETYRNFAHYNDDYPANYFSTEHEVP